MEHGRCCGIECTMHEDRTCPYLCNDAFGIIIIATRLASAYLNDGMLQIQYMSYFVRVCVYIERRMHDMRISKHKWLYF